MWINTHDKNRLYAQSFGDEQAPVLIFCNSLGTDHTMWQPQIDALAADYRMIAYDTRGHGRSSAEGSGWTLADLGKDVISVLDGFGIGLGAAYYHANLNGTATGVVNGETATARDSIGEHAFAPLLEVGWRHAFTPDLRMYAEASGIKKNGGRINGHIYGGNIGVEWFPFKNIGFVADYGISKIKLHRDSERNADLNIRLTGPSAYVKVRF